MGSATGCARLPRPGLTRTRSCPVRWCKSQCSSTIYGGSDWTYQGIDADNPGGALSLLGAVVSCVMYRPR
jgi:hypothetical protein